MTWTIYKIVHINTGRAYVGQTTRSLATRLRGHFEQAKSARPRCPRLAAAIVFYGRDAFAIEAIAATDSQQDADRLEAEWIAALCTIENGFNVRTGGRRAPNSPDTIQKMKAAHAGKIIADDTRQKISRALTGRKNGPPSDGTRAKISAALMGGKRTPKQREALSLAHRGRKLSAKHRAAQSAGKRAAWAAKTPEEKAAIVSRRIAGLSPEVRRARAIKIWESRRANKRNKDTQT